MKKLGIGVLLLAAGQVHADTTGGYVGLNTGTYLYDEETNIFDDIELRGWTVGGQAGYMFTNWMGVEATYQRYFEDSDDIAGIDISAEGDYYTVSLRPAWQVTHDFELYAKVGIGFWDIEVEVDVPGFASVEGEDDGSDFAWGFGGRWWGGEAWSLGLEFNRLEAENDVQWDNVTFNAAYHF